VEARSTKLGDRVITAARAPLVHFLVLGAAIYGLYGLAGPKVDEEAGNKITVSAAANTPVIPSLIKKNLF